MSALKRSVLLLEMSTLQGPELHLDVSALQRNVLLLEVSTLQGPKLHLDVSALQRSVLLLEVSATGPELHLDVSALQRHVLLLEVSATEANFFFFQIATPRINDTGSRFSNRNIEGVRFASKIICLLSDLSALLQK
jgi:hypothetical protein